MAALLLGLLIFLGVHSVRIFADGWRTRMVERLGLWPWKVLYGLVSLAGLVLLVYGYGLTRAEPMVLWTPPVFTRHLAALLTLPAFVLLLAPYVPLNAVKAGLGHPMVLGVKLWALAHLLANGSLADLLLFGGFLLWAILDFRSLRERDHHHGKPAARSQTRFTLLTLVLGAVAWAAFARWGHAALIGVQPFGG